MIINTLEGRSLHFLGGGGGVIAGGVDDLSGAITASRI